MLTFDWIIGHLRNFEMLVSRYGDLHLSQDIRPLDSNVEVLVTRYLVPNATNQLR